MIVMSERRSIEDEEEEEVDKEYKKAKAFSFLKETLNWFIEKQKREIYEDIECWEDTWRYYCRVVTRPELNDPMPWDEVTAFTTHVPEEEYKILRGLGPWINVTWKFLRTSEGTVIVVSIQK